MKHINNTIRRAMALMAVMVVATATAMAQVKYIDADGTEKTCSSYNTVGNGINVTWDGGWYVVNGSGLSITNSVTVSGAVNLILADGASLTVTGAADEAGIIVTGTSNSLTIYGQTAGTGTLNATGGDKGAGIGGGKGQDSGNITINGGTITATGAGGGAGIGGGIGGSIGNFVMNRGTVTANGSLLATGVGAGDKSPVFSVSADKTVEFAPGNLYWNGSSWKFEVNQWDYRTLAGNKSCIGGNVSETGTPDNNCGLFKWGNKNEAIDQTQTPPSGEFFTEASGFTVDDQPGWRTLSKDEWKNLLGISDAPSPRDNASSLRGWRTVAGVPGLVILPDNTENPAAVLSGITTAADLAAAAAVFLPAAGHRVGTDVSNVGSHSYYWSSTLSSPNYAYYMHIYLPTVYATSDDRYRGYCVRLVR